MPRIEDKLGLGELNTQFYTHVANHHDFFKSANPEMVGLLMTREIHTNGKICGSD